MAGGAYEQAALGWLAALAAASAVVFGSAAAPPAFANSARPPATPAPSAARREPSDWVVVAPHPDDAVLLAAGVLLRARQDGHHVAVVVLTNGDFDCRCDGLLRERESVDGLAELGVGEDDVYFLGYPDGHLADLGRAPLLPVPRLQGGTCVRGNRTYGDRGYGRRDFHAAVHGAPATYTVENAVSDLALLVERLRPRVLVVTHPNDTHPDHAATYVLVRRAMDRLSFAPSVLTGIVHNGDCWPTGGEARAQCPPARIEPAEPLPPLSGALAGYGPELRIEVPNSCLSPAFDQNPKLRAIFAHHSQTHDDPGSYLFAFARRDELFFPQSFSRAADGHYEPTAAPAGPGREPGAGVRKAARGVPEVLMRTRVARAGQAANTSPANTASGQFTLRIDVRSREASLFENTSPRAPALLRRWPLPADSFTHGDETFTLEREYAAGNAVELALYDSGVLVGVHVVVRSTSSR